MSRLLSNTNDLNWGKDVQRMEHMDLSLQITAFCTGG